MTPDSSRVVYLADQDTDDVDELYSVPIDGSQAPVKLNATLVAGGDVAIDPAAVLSNAPYAISADSSRVVYRADQEQDERRELYSVPLTGGPAVKLNASLVAGGDVGVFAIDPGSARVVYVADEASAGVPELYSVPLTGGARVRLSAALLPGEGVRTDADRGAPFRLSALGAVSYRQQANGRFELWSVPLVGGAAPRKLNAPLPSGGDVSADFQLTVDGAGVVYAADQLVDDVVELFLVPLDASAPPQRISGAMVQGGDVLLDRGSFQIAGDGRGVIYRADQDTDGVPELYAALLDFQRGPRRAGTPTRLR